MEKQIKRHVKFNPQWFSAWIAVWFTLSSVYLFSWGELPMCSPCKQTSTGETLYSLFSKYRISVRLRRKGPYSSVGRALHSYVEMQRSSVRLWLWADHKNGLLFFSTMWQIIFYTHYLQFHFWYSELIDYYLFQLKLCRTFQKFQLEPVLWVIVVITRFWLWR